MPNFPIIHTKPNGMPERKYSQTIEMRSIPDYSGLRAPPQQSSQEASERSVKFQQQTPSALNH